MTANTRVDDCASLFVYKHDMASKLDILRALEKKVLWLSSWMIHNANHLRDNTDGLKVGGHQASSASIAGIMTALYFDVLKSEDRVAVKPHGAPIFHAIQYLMSRQTREPIVDGATCGEISTECDAALAALIGDS